MTPLHPKQAQARINRAPRGLLRQRQRENIEGVAAALRLTIADQIDRAAMARVEGRHG